MLLNVGDLAAVGNRMSPPQQELAFSPQVCLFFPSRKPKCDKGLRRV